jgi:hypothetical protein
MAGWYDGSTYGIDVPQEDPYTNYESFFDTDFIPVGTLLDPFTPSQVEWKTSRPLVTGEGVKMSYRTNIAEAFTLIGETLPLSADGRLSDVYQTNFQKAQWVQLRVHTKSTATNPTYTRVTECRLRDFPSGTANNS